MESIPEIPEDVIKVKPEDLIRRHDVGKVVVCPKCGLTGKVVIEVFRKGSRTYYYLAVRHVVKHARVRRCWIRRLEEREVSETKGVVSESTSETKGRVSESELERLRRENEELRRRVSELSARLEQMQVVRDWIVGARASALVLGRDHVEALKAVYIDKRSGLPVDVREMARSVMWRLVEGVRESGVGVVVFSPLPNFEF